nr:MAG TPA: hypothetical protein [Caudoviricetes sp.]
MTPIYFAVLGKYSLLISFAFFNFIVYISLNFLTPFLFSGIRVGSNPTILMRGLT